MEMDSLFEDLSALKLDQSFADMGGVKKLLKTVPVRKPNRQDFVRVHPDPKFRLSPAALIELKEDRETYLVTPSWRQTFPANLVRPLCTWPAIDKVSHLCGQSKLPGLDGKINSWHESAAEAAELAMSRWIRMTANMALGAYELFEATGNLPDPIWPEHTFPEILQIAFRGRVIDTADHPLVLKLQGQQ